MQRPTFGSLIQLCSYSNLPRYRVTNKGEMHRDDPSKVTFLVQDLEAVLEMNRLLEKENEELKQEVKRLRAQISNLKAHDHERKCMLWKKIQHSTNSNNREGMLQKPTTPEKKSASDIPCYDPDLQEYPVGKGCPRVLQEPQKFGSTHQKMAHSQKVSTAGPPPPPPPPPSKSFFGSKSVCRVPEVIEFYRYLTKRNAQLDNKPNVIGLPPEANPRNMIGEIENRSTYHSAIKSDVERQAEFINFLAREVETATFKEISQVEAFVKWLDGELSCLVDEGAVLKYFPQWPERKADALREAACCYRDLVNIGSEVSSFEENPNQTFPNTLARIHTMQDRLERTIAKIERTREGTSKRYKEMQIPWEWMNRGLLGQVKLGSLKLAKEYMEKTANSLQSSRCYKTEDLMLQAVRFAYRVHQFVGGFDTGARKAFEELKQLHTTHFPQAP